MRRRKTADTCSGTLCWLSDTRVIHMLVIYNNAGCSASIGLWTGGEAHYTVASVRKLYNGHCGRENHNSRSVEEEKGIKER